MNSAIRYFNSVRYLKPYQIVYQIYRKTVHKHIVWYEYKEWKTQKCPINAEILDTDEDYTGRFFVQGLVQNEICLLNQSFHWKRGCWDNPEASHLWNFNLHYFEYGVALAACFKKTGEVRYRQKLIELIKDWIGNVRAGDGWQPYTISLRIPNWLIAFELLGEPVPPDILHSIYIQYRWLLRNQEKHLLGNHYLENLKTILICSHLFKEDIIFNRYIKKFIKEIGREILADGVHFELSLMYHKIVLEDLFRVALLLEYRKNRYLEDVISIIKKMNNAMYSLEIGMGKTPHFNDSGDNISKGMEQLSRGLREKWGIEPQRENVFPVAGYYKLHRNDTALLFDCGPLGPQYMCGHSHCDALSFELSVADVPLLVNAGTYQYQDITRYFFRSTEAHNTVVIGGEQQSELWGEHRAARRIRNVRCQYGQYHLQGSYYTFKGRYHRRQIWMENESVINILDQIRGPSGKTVSAFFRAAPGFIWDIEEDYGISLVNGTNRKCKLKLSFNNGEAYVHRNDALCKYSRNFGKLESCEVLEIRYLIQNGLAESNIRLLIST